MLVIVMIPCGILSGGIIFLMFTATGVAGTVVFGILYGFFSGGCTSFISSTQPRSHLDLNYVV